MWKSLEAGKWLYEEEFEMIDSFPAAKVYTGVCEREGGRVRG